MWTDDTARVGPMTPAEPPAVHRVGSLQYSDTQMRVLVAALDLFAEHGVHGTSLQMIADDLGVTKAAVYHQFRTKEAIVVGAVEIELGNLDGALEAAEAGGPGPEAVESLLQRVIDLAVARRRMVGTLQHDPVIVRLLGEFEPFQQFMQRLFGVLLAGGVESPGPGAGGDDHLGHRRGGDPSPGRRPRRRHAPVRAGAAVPGDARPPRLTRWTGIGPARRDHRRDGGAVPFGGRSDRYRTHEE